MRGRSDGRTDGRTDRQMDGQTDATKYIISLASRSITKRKRDLFYNSRKKTSICDNVENNTYINENLTLHRAKLFHDACKLKWQGRLYATWTQFGSPMVKGTIEDTPRAVYDHCDLQLTLWQVSNQNQVTGLHFNKAYTHSGTSCSQCVYPISRKRGLNKI